MQQEALIGLIQHSIGIIVATKSILKKLYGWTEEDFKEKIKEWELLMREWPVLQDSKRKRNK